MAGATKLAEKVPGWVERLLIPTLESRIRVVVKEEVGNLEKVMIAKFDAVNTRIDSVEKRVDARFDGVDDRFDAVDSRIDSLEKRLPMIQDIADLKARLAVVEKRAQ